MIMEHKTFKISGLSVLFPCKPYPSQLSMMDKVIKGIDRRQNCLLESPTGSGKSLALLCSSLAWQREEKVKKEKEDAEYIEKASCPCDCHKEKIPSNNENSKPAPAERNTDDASMKPEHPTIIHLDNDDDFKTDAIHFNKTSTSTKNPRKHISVSYETNQDCVKQDSIVTPDDSSQNKQENLSSTDGNKSCTLCSCNLENKPPRKLPKIYFGTRTHKQVAQIVRELRKTSYHDVKMTILGSREHTCIHPEVSKMKNKNEGCKDLLNGPGCSLKDRAQRYMSHDCIKSQGLASAWDLEDLVNMCQPKKVCPYFLSRGLKEEADLIICPYNYLVEPLIRDAMQINLKGHIVIFDEAHNIEDSAREAASQTVSQESITSAMSDIEALMENHNLADYSKLRHMLKKLDSFIDENKDKLEQKDFNQSYKIWNGFYIVAQLETLGMGPKHFPDLKSALASIKRDAEERKDEALRQGWNPDTVEMKPATQNLLDQLFMVMDYLYRNDLKYVEDYRASLVHSMSFVRKQAVGQWLSTQSRGGGRMVQVENLNLNFWCMNPGVAFSDFSETRSVILTSGTLSPLASFQSELGLDFKIQLEANHVIKDFQVWVGTLGQGPNGTNLQAVFRNLETYTFQDELGNLILKVCETIPHGVLCFLPSYKVLEKLCNRWEITGLMSKISQRKIVLCEPRGSDKSDFELKMQQFYDAVNESSDNQTVTDDDKSKTNGAVMFAVCRGKVSEGLDFADNFARAVISVGIPYPNFKDVQVELKRKYNDEHCKSRDLLSGHAWYEIQAFRALNQALGRCIRHRNDWGALIIVDDRFVKNPQKYCQGLSKWVRSKVRNFERFGGVLGSLNEFVGQSKKREEEIRASEVEKSILSPPPTPEGKLTSLKSSPHVNTSFIKEHSSPTTPSAKHFSIFAPVPKGKTVRQGQESPRPCVPEAFKPGPKLPHDDRQTSSFSWSRAMSSSLSATTSSVNPNANTRSVPTLPPHNAQGLRGQQQLKISLTSPALNYNSNRVSIKKNSSPDMPHKSEQIFLEEDKNILRIITEKAPLGVSSRVFKIPKHLHPIYGGDLNLPVSSSERFVYIIKPPTSPGNAPIARISKMSDQKIESLLKSHRDSTNENCNQELTEKCVGKSMNESTALLQAADHSKIASDESKPTETSVSIADNDFHAAREHLGNESQRTCENPDVQTDNDKDSNKSEILTDKPKSNMRYGKSSLKSCHLGQPEQANPNSNSSTEDLKVSLNKTKNPPFPSPLLFNQELSIQTKEHTSQETPNLCMKKPLFKRKEETKTVLDFSIIPKGDSTSATESKPSEEWISEVRTAAALPKAELGDEKFSHVRITSTKDMHTNPEGNNSDFADEAEGDKLVLKRKNRRRRSSLKLTNEKKIKRESDVPLDESQEEGSYSFSCLSCGCALFDDKIVSDGFSQQKAIPSFLQCQTSDERKTSGCLFFHTCPETSRLQPLTEGFPGLSLKYIEQEEICVLFVYCVHCLKEWKAENSGTPSPVGAQVKMAAGSGSRFKKGQMWLFLHAVHCNNR